MNTYFTCSLCQSTAMNRLGCFPEFDDPNKTFELYQCFECKIIITYPEMNDDALSPYYANQYYGSEKKKFIAPIEKVTIFLNYLLARHILSKHHGGDTPQILDIGCGRAHLLQNMHKMGGICHGVERKGIFKSEKKDGVCFHSQALNDIHFDENQFDAVIMWHVLEHLCHPIPVLNEIYRIMKTNATLWIAVPNIGSWQYTIFKKHWFHLDIPRHRFHFNRTSLERLLKGTGFQIKACHTVSIEQNVYGFIQSFMNTISFKEKPHRFYECLKFNSNDRSKRILIKGSMTALLIILFGFIEFFLSGVCGKGAVLICEITKSAPKSGNP